jgi:hypothetical protein
MFYGLGATKKSLIYGADVLNAFAEAPPPSKDLYIPRLGISGMVGESQKEAAT